MIQCPCGATDESYVPLCAYDNCHGAYILQKRKDEALLKQALDALERVLPLAKDSTTQPSLDIDILDAVSAITALRERLK
jgi:hypothetical protein